MATNFAYNKNKIISKAKVMHNNDLRNYATQIFDGDDKAVSLYKDNIKGLDSYERSEYAAVYLEYARAGYTGKDIQSIKSFALDSTIISEDVKKSIYDLGKKQALQVKASDKKAAKNYAKKLGNLIATNEIRNQSESTVLETLDSMARIIGTDIHLEVLEEGVNGKLNDDGSITININSKTPYAFVMGHELTHYLQDSAPESYGEFKKYIRQAYDKSNPDVSYDKKIKEYQDLYKTKANQELTFSQAEDEFIADSTDVFFTDPEFTEMVVSQNKPLAEKILGAIRHLINKFKSLTGGKAATKGIYFIEQTLKKGKKLWVEMIAESQSR